MGKTKNSIDNIYSSLVSGLNLQLQSDDFYQYFIKCIKAGRNNTGLTRKVVERTVSGDWLNIIEDTIIPLDTIIRNPRRYIKNLEEVVPIEMARGISTESVKHLAQHTNMIAQVSPDGMVTPERILNILKEESYDTYENRFIFTLLQNLDYFIGRRLNVLNEGGKDITEFVLHGECMVGKEKIGYRMNFSCEGGGHFQNVAPDEILNEDVTKLTVAQRIERVRRILYNFQESFLIKELKDCAIVRPPLHMTNVLTKNPEFVKAVELWNFLNNYKDDGIESSVVETTVVPNEKFIGEMYSLLPLEYALLKQTVEGVVEVAPEAMMQQKDFNKPMATKERVEEFLDTLDLDIDEIRKVFNESLARKSKKFAMERNRIDGIIKRVFEIEKPWLEKEKLRLKNKEKKILAAEKAERARLKKEEERLKEEQRLYELEQARLAEEEAKRLAEEAARLEAERLERERLEAEGLIVVPEADTATEEASFDAAIEGVEAPATAEEAEAAEASDEPVTESVEPAEAIAGEAEGTEFAEPATEFEAEAAENPVEEAAESAPVTELAEDAEIAPAEEAEAVEAAETEETEASEVTEAEQSEEAEIEEAEAEAPAAEKGANPFRKMVVWFRNLMKKPTEQSVPAEAAETDAEAENTEANNLETEEIATENAETESAGANTETESREAEIPAEVEDLTSEAEDLTDETAEDVAEAAEPIADEPIAEAQAEETPDQPVSEVEAAEDDSSQQIAEESAVCELWEEAPAEPAENTELTDVSVDGTEEAVTDVSAEDAPAEIAAEAEASALSDGAASDEETFDGVSDSETESEGEQSPSGRVLKNKLRLKNRKKGNHAANRASLGSDKGANQ